MFLLCCLFGVFGSILHQRFSFMLCLYWKQAKILGATGEKFHQYTKRRHIWEVFLSDIQPPCLYIYITYTMLKQIGSCSIGTGSRMSNVEADLACHKTDCPGMTAGRAAMGKLVRNSRDSGNQSLAPSPSWMQLSQLSTFCSAEPILRKLGGISHSVASGCLYRTGTSTRGNCIWKL